MICLSAASFHVGGTGNPGPLIWLAETLDSLLVCGRLIQQTERRAKSQNLTARIAGKV